jgi:N,N'-diacetyllegionaminate synthase
MNIYIGNKKVGNKSPCFIIAEAGVNHNGDVNLAKQLILKAKEVGADCVKFQTFKAEQVVTPNAPKAMYQLKNTNPRESQIAMLKKLELSSESYYELIQLCKKIDIVFMSTPYNYEDVEFLERLNVCAYKLPSISIVEPSFLEYVANKNKPMIVSTGMATLNEVSDGVRTIITSGNKKLIILHCTTNYPTALSDANLNAMKTMGDRLNVLFGYSDHTQEDVTCMTAVALGACVIEKHFTLDKNLPGPDQSSSYNPRQFKKFVKNIRNVELVLGSKIKKPSAAELKNIKGMRRSVVANKLIRKKTIIDQTMLTLKRPASGLKPKFLKKIIGKTAKRNIYENEFINNKDFLK